MKLAAIYNVYDGVELLRPSMKCLYDHVDLLIIVYQDVSNFGETDSPFADIEELGLLDKVILVKFDPIVEMGGSMNERAKRNLGIDFARANHCTHFLSLDVDEFYEDFGDAKRQFIRSGGKGSVCRMHTYFKTPTFRFDRPEDYFVPFIHELRDETASGASRYQFYVDPTRRVNEEDVVELPIFMHHFSWVRKDIMRKARNSSATGIISNSTIMDDYNNPNLSEGFLLRNWGRKIVAVEDKFGLAPIFK